jgi:RNA polymerase sigma factor (sigma-70 family)
MQEQQLIPHLFKTEYRKLTAVLCKLFGIEHIEIAEDIVSDTFLLATETWPFKGVPPNPVAWVYTVAKNKSKDYLKRNTLFEQKVKHQLLYSSTETEIAIDFSDKNILDSQLQMMFAVCYPSISVEAQIGLSLRILCGFGIEEIANAFLSNKETINKRLFRAKEKLKADGVKIELPPVSEIKIRIDTVLTTLYLLFNEGYYSLSSSFALRKDLCLEAMRLTHLLTQNSYTNKPSVSSLLALMCFHSSRFEARQNLDGEMVLYEDQDISLWNTELIARGEYFLIQASKDKHQSKYYFEAAIAYWHTRKTNEPKKWEYVLLLYNQLLTIEYSPMAALNRIYALSKVYGKETAIAEAEKLEMNESLLYHSLLGDLYMEADNYKAIMHFNQAKALSKSDSEKKIFSGKILKCEMA